jgi:MOSC domain-containing protein YiiM
MVKRFTESRRTGFYFAVHCEGEVGAGDSIEVRSRDENQVTVSAITRLYLDDDDPEAIERVLRVPALPLAWREYILTQINPGER